MWLATTMVRLQVLVVFTFWTVLTGQTVAHSRHFDISLEFGPDQYSGILELMVAFGTQTRTGLVCNTGLHDLDAFIICRLLNYTTPNTESIFVPPSHFGPTDSGIWVLTCPLSANNISSCSVSPSSCDPNNTVGLDCRYTTSNKPDSRPDYIREVELEGGPDQYSGWMEVAIERWGENGAEIVTGLVCNVGWSDLAAFFLCNLLKYTEPSTVSNLVPPDIYGQPRPGQWSVQCPIAATNVSQCLVSNISCEPSEVVAVNCRTQTGNSSCPSDTDYKGTVWDATRPGATVTADCPTGYDGRAYRTCSTKAIWREPRYNECVKKDIKEKTDLIDDLAKGTIPPPPDVVLSAVLDLVTSTEPEVTEVTSGDIKSVVRVLPLIVSLDNATKGGINLTEAFVSVVSNVLTRDSRREWISIRDKSGSPTLISLLRAVKDTGFVAANKPTKDDKPVVIVRENIVLEAGRVTSQDITFPTIQQIPAQTDDLDCRNAVSLTLRKATLDNLKTETGDHPYTAALFNTLGHLQANDEVEGAPSANISTTAPVISIHLESDKEIELHPPLEITFKACVVKSKQLSSSGLSPRIKREEPGVEIKTENIMVPPPKKCFRKEENGNWIIWTTDGCEVVKNTNDVTECKCSKTGHTASSFQKFLRKVKDLLAKYACLFPIFAVVFKLAKNLKKTCKIKSDSITQQPLRRLLIGLFLSFIIIISNAELIAAVDKTEDKDSCMAIAATLHFFFLVECFFFSAQAVDVFLPEELGKVWFFLLFGLPWVLASVLVGIAVGIFTREEYLGENLCWVSLESGSYLFLVVPAVLMPVVQFLALLKKSRETICSCESAETEGESTGCARASWKRFISWLKDNRETLMFAVGITQMCAQILLSVFADTDDDVVDAFFGFFSFTKGLILAFSGISKDENSKDSGNTMDRIGDNMRDNDNENNPTDTDRCLTTSTTSPQETSAALHPSTNQSLQIEAVAGDIVFTENQDGRFIVSRQWKFSYTIHSENPQSIVNPDYTQSTSEV